MRKKYARQVSANGEKPLDFLSISAEIPGQSYPRHYPHPEDALGQPLAIREVAEAPGLLALDGAPSYLPKGLPHLGLVP